MDIASKSYQHGKKTVTFLGFQSLQMSSSLTENRGEELLMLYLADFHAKTSAQQEKGQELTESEAECGGTWQGWLAKYDPATCSWKTRQCSLSEDLAKSLAILPKSGMTRDGLLWELPTLVRRTVETVFGFSVPTPVSSDATSGAVIGKNDTYYITSTGMPRKVNRNGIDGSVGLGRLVQMWPTPTVCGNYNRKGASKTSGEGLATAGRNWLTPTAFMHKDSTTDRGKSNLGEVVGGKLNPDWTEWLMGWPIKWTSLDNFREENFQSWLAGSSVTDETQKTSWWGADPSEGESNTAEKIPKVCTSVEARVARIKAIGNGQVPLCAAEAWRILRCRHYSKATALTC
jgi:hypothetical protein